MQHFSRLDVITFLMGFLSCGIVVSIVLAINHVIGLCSR